MLNLSVTIEGDRIVINNLERLSSALPQATKRALSRIAQGVFSEAHAFLAGPGGAGKKQKRRPAPGEKTGFTKKSGERVDFSLLEGAGAYPVPVRTGFLRQALYFLNPGESASLVSGSDTAGPNEAVIGDAAQYANVIHEGTGSSAKYGPRRYLTDGFERFNGAGRAVSIIEEEIAREVGR